MAAAPDYYTGFTQAEVEAILAAQKAELTKTLQNYSEGGTQVNKRRIDEINLVIRGCQVALQKFDPETYGNKRKRVGLARASCYLPK